MMISQRGCGGVRRVPLAAVDDVLVTVPHDRALDVGGVARGDSRLGHRERRPDLARQQPCQPPRLLLGSAVPSEHLHVAGVRSRAVEHLRSEVRSPHHFAQRRVLEVGEPCTLIALGEEQVPQPGRPRERLELLDHRPHRPRAELHRLAEEAGFVGVDVLVHERLEPVRAARLSVRSQPDPCGAPVSSIRMTTAVVGLSRASVTCQAKAPRMVGRLCAGDRR